MIHEDHRISKTIAAVVCLILTIYIAEGCSRKWVVKAITIVLEAARGDLILKLLIGLELLACPLPLLVHPVSLKLLVCYLCL